MVHAGLYVNQLLAYNNSNPNPTEMMSSHIFLLDERSISNAPFHSVKPALGFFLLVQLNCCLRELGDIHLKLAYNFIRA
jgi:hypothetical protein